MPRPGAVLSSRLRLAGLYLLVMGAILYGAAFGIVQLLIRSNWLSVEREVASLGGTLHDSLKPLLPAEARPSEQLAAVLPGLCLQGRPCAAAPSLIQRHALGISDGNLFYLRLLGPRGEQLAHTPNQPVQSRLERHDNRMEVVISPSGERFLQYTIHLHRSHEGLTAAAGPAGTEWGYLQIGRSLRWLDQERQRLWLIGHGMALLALGVVGVASWIFAGLAMRPLLTAYRQQEQFTADAAHELRSPLASLLAVVAASRERIAADPVAGTEALDRIEGQGRRLSRLIADLLLLASLEKPRGANPSPQVCRLGQVVQDLAEEFSESAAVAGLELVVALPSDGVEVLGSESELYRLIANLLGNAIQYTPSGGRIDVSLQRERGAAVIEISDSGIGIAQEDQRRIFDRFFRADQGRSRRCGGTGLGLSIVAAIVRRHGGAITVRSNGHSGSSFTVTLPLAASSHGLPAPR
jgi:two-component Ni(II)/redox sensor kinase NrsS